MVTKRGHEHGRHFTPISRPDLAAIQDALADLLLAHRHDLRWPPHKAARLVHLVTVASTHPILTDDQPFTTDEILDLLVHGVTADEPTVADEPMLAAHNCRRARDRRRRCRRTAGTGPLMLIRLLGTYLRPYRGPLAAVVLFQFIGTIASLYLPELNAEIIDDGVAQGDTGLIMSKGGIMLAVTIVQIICTIIAVYFGARTAMGFGRDVRAALFQRVGTFSDREMAKFGAPTLITRNTNDVQQVQMLVLMTCTLLVAAPIMCVGGVFMALRTDFGLAWLLLISVPVLVLAIGLIVVRMIPSSGACRTASTWSIASCGNRSRACGWSGHSSASLRRSGASRTRTRSSPTRRCGPAG